MPGVVSLPHGWGHDARRACGWPSPPRTPGVNSNLLADERSSTRCPGNAVLNGIPVAVAPVRTAGRAGFPVPA